MARYLRPFSILCFFLAPVLEEWAVTLSLLGLLHVLYIFYRSLRVEGKGRGVLITGCDSGFGHQLAKTLHSMNFTVFATCLDANSPGGQSLQRLGVHVLTVDICRQEQVDEALKTVEERLPPLGLWALVNNAGVGISGFAEWIPIEYYQKMMSVNVLGHIRMTKTFLPLMRRSSKDGGRIVNTTSTLARTFLPLVAPYCLTKSALDAFSTSLRRELASFNIDVVLIEPGNFTSATAITAGSGLLPLEDGWQQLSEAVRKDYGHRAFERLKRSVEAYHRIAGNDISMVCEAMAEPVIRRYPKSRYIPSTYFEWLLVTSHQLLPDFLMDIAIDIGDFIRLHLLLNNWI